MAKRHRKEIELRKLARRDHAIKIARARHEKRERIQAAKLQGMRAGHNIVYVATPPCDLVPSVGAAILAARYR
jgi:hypothetical protein